MKRLPYIATLLIAIVSFACNNAQKQEEPTEITPDVAKDANDEVLDGNKERDSKRIVDLYNGSLEEIDLCEEGATHASNRKVKEFADHMVAEHTEMNKSINELAANLNMTLPSDIEEGAKKDITDLNDKKGSDYDKAFMDKAISSHRDAIDLATKLSEDGYNETVKKFFTDALPRLRHHLEMAEAAKAAIK